MHSLLDELRTQMQDAEPVLKVLDCELEKIQFDPLAPASVETAKAQVDALIETRLAAFKENPILGPLTEQLKTQYIEAIQEQVEAASGHEQTKVPT